MLSCAPARGDPPASASRGAPGGPIAVASASVSSSLSWCPRPVSCLSGRGRWIREAEAGRSRAQILQEAPLRDLCARELPYPTFQRARISGHPLSSSCSPLFNLIERTRVESGFPGVQGSSLLGGRRGVPGRRPPAPAHAGSTRVPRVPRSGGPLNTQPHPEPGSACFSLCRRHQENHRSPQEAPER